MIDTSNLNHRCPYLLNYVDHILILKIINPNRRKPWRSTTVHVPRRLVGGMHSCNNYIYSSLNVELHSIYSIA